MDSYWEEVVKLESSFLALHSLFFCLGRDPNAESTQNVFMSTDGSVIQTNAMVSLYIERRESLKDISLFNFMTKYCMSTVVTAHLKLRTPVGRYDYDTRRRTDAIVFVRARIESSDGETFDKAMLYLHFPWRSLSGIVPAGKESSSAPRLVAERDASSSLRSMIHN